MKSPFFNSPRNVVTFYKMGNKLTHIHQKSASVRHQNNSSQFFFPKDKKTLLLAPNPLRDCLFSESYSLVTDLLDYTSNQAIFKYLAQNRGQISLLEGGGK